MDRRQLPLSFLVILLCVQAAIFVDAWSSLFTLWLKLDYAYSMGTLALGLAIYTIFQHRTKITHNTSKPHISSYILLLASSAILTASAYLNIQVGMQLMLLPVIFFGASSLLGYKSAQYLFIPLCYLLFAIPVWDYTNTTLQSMTTSASTYLIELLSLPAFIEGNIVHLPYGVLEIAGGCSGLRYFLVSLILALYFSQQRPNAPKIVASMFFIAALFSLFANWIRVTLLIIIAEKSNMQSSLVADHETFGWIVYLVVMAPCVWAMLVIEKRNLANSPSSEVPNASTASSYELKAAHLILAIIITGISPLLVGLSSTINASKQGELSIDISPPPSGWMKTATSKSATYTSGFIGVQQENNFSLVNSTSGTQVHVQVLSYTAEEQGSELINDSNQLADKQWNIANTSTSSENLGAAILTNARRDQVAVLWYFRVGDYRTSNPLKAKLAQLLNVFSPDTAKAHVSLSVQCSSNCEKEMLALNKLSTNYRPY